MIKDEWLVIKTLKFFREKFKTLTSPKILLKTFRMVSKKGGVSLDSFLGAEPRLKGPFLFTGPEVPDLTPSVRQDPACCHSHFFFFFCALQAPQA